MRWSLILLMPISTTMAATLPFMNRYHSTGINNALTFNISRSFVIALDPLLGANVAHTASLYLGMHDMTIFRAINATEALVSVTTDDMPLYTRRLLQVGRSEHMQLGNAAMLGCLLSHMAIWEQIQEGETVAVFEEDAQFDEVAAARLRTLAADIHPHEWHMLILEAGQSLIATGTRKQVGELAETCATNSPTPCTWYGTRGYLLKHSGAKLLHRHAKPFIVQVDALIGLVAAAFPDAFRLYWSRYDVAYPSNWRRSVIFDGCISCIFPTVELYVYILISLLTINILVMWLLAARQRSNARKHAHAIYYEPHSVHLPLRNGWSLR